MRGPRDRNSVRRSRCSRLLFGIIDVEGLALHSFGSSLGPVSADVALASLLYILLDGVLHTHDQHEVLLHSSFTLLDTIPSFDYSSFMTFTGLQRQTGHQPKCTWILLRWNRVVSIVVASRAQVRWAGADERELTRLMTESRDNLLKAESIVRFNFASRYITHMVRQFSISMAC
ncbi:hypothetical protein DFH29DRAFT_257680 [Suillus ampliporus]|nr:hypothetical protein DFH29DRAFT_257680 [Suillus ampliporus]